MRFKARNGYLIGGLAMALMAAPASAAPRSIVSGVTKHREHVGECFATKVLRVENRLEDGSGQFMANSGSAIVLADGHYNVGYDQLPAIDTSRPGDRIRLYVIKLPTHCPRGDTRGILYRGMNLRTGLSWKAIDSEHICGGA